MITGILLLFRSVGVYTGSLEESPVILQTRLSYVILGKERATQFRGIRAEASKHQVGGNMRRIFWTAGMSVVGVFLALKGQDVTLNVKEVAVGGIWAGCIGYGFGSIFDQRMFGTRLIFYWAITLALVGLFFGPLLPVGTFLVRQTLGALIAALAGVLIGTLQLRRTRRKLRSSPITNAVG